MYIFYGLNCSHYMSWHIKPHDYFPWWRHQMETFYALLAICAGNSPVTGEFPAQRPVTPNFDVFFDRRLNKRLSKQSWSWWFETPWCPLWRHCNVLLADLQGRVCELLRRRQRLYWQRCALRPHDATGLEVIITCTTWQSGSRCWRYDLETLIGLLRGNPL